MNVLKFLLLFIIAVIIGVFGAHNSQMVPVSFYPFDLQVSIAVFFLFFIALLLGVVLAAIAGIGKIISYRKTIRTKNRQIEALEKENANLRAEKATSLSL